MRTFMQCGRCWGGKAGGQHSAQCRRARVGSRIADSGNELTMSFCGDCGTTLFGNNNARPQVTGAFGGALDDPSWVPIQAHIWTDSALEWMAMDPGTEQFVPSGQRLHGSFESLTR